MNLVPYCVCRELFISYCTFHRVFVSSSRRGHVCDEEESSPDSWNRFLNSFAASPSLYRVHANAQSTTTTRVGCGSSDTKEPSPRSCGQSHFQLGASTGLNCTSHLSHVFGWSGSIDLCELLRAHKAGLCRFNRNFL